MFLSVFFFRNSLQFKKVSLPLQPQTRNNGAIAQLVEQSPAIIIDERQKVQLQFPKYHPDVLPYVANGMKSL